MARDGVNAEMARQREAELRRVASRLSARAEALAQGDAARPMAQNALGSVERPARAPGIRPATIEDLVAVAGESREFWGDRELASLHHPLLVHDFGETALVIRGEADGRGTGAVIAYLFGLLTPSGVGYVHLVAVREGRRRGGFARRLYERFEVLAREHDAHALKALTQPLNTRSIAFHRALGFTASEAGDYAGPGQARIVLWKELPVTARGVPAEIVAGLSN
jgi:ribosomal protein S18 acetylase RimI-like enzyme